MFECSTRTVNINVYVKSLYFYHHRSESTPMNEKAYLPVCQMVTDALGFPTCQILMLSDGAQPTILKRQYLTSWETQSVSFTILQTGALSFLQYQGNLLHP